MFVCYVLTVPVGSVWAYITETKSTNHSEWRYLSNYIFSYSRFNFKSWSRTRPVCQTKSDLKRTRQWEMCFLVHLMWRLNYARLNQLIREDVSGKNKAKQDIYILFTNKTPLAGHSRSVRQYSTRAWLRQTDKRDRRGQWLCNVSLGR